MSFLDLHEHIQGTFAAFSGVDEYDIQLTLWCYRARERRAEVVRNYRKNHPAVRVAEAKRRWQRTKASKTCRYCGNPPAQRTKRLRGKRVTSVLCEVHLEAARIRERNRYAARKARSPQT